ELAHGALVVPARARRWVAVRARRAAGDRTGERSLGLLPGSAADRARRRLHLALHLPGLPGKRAAALRRTVAHAALRGDRRVAAPVGLLAAGRLPVLRRVHPRAPGRADLSARRATSLRTRGL